MENDDDERGNRAVWSYFSGVRNWQAMDYLIAHPYAGRPMNFAFTINAAETVYDFGDAPDPPYPTLLANNGPRHMIRDGVVLGYGITDEPDGKPGSLATNDDGAVASQYNGVSLMSVPEVGKPLSLRVRGLKNAVLQGWVDFNRNGSWADPGEHVLTDRRLSAVTNDFTFDVPVQADDGITYARFRYSTQTGLGFTGQTVNGEVEDYRWLVYGPDFPQVDFGDARAPFPVLLADDGARHMIVPGVRLGAYVDPEVDGTSSKDANADDLNFLRDDEDGLTFLSSLSRGYTNTVTVKTSTNGYLSGWIDFNSDDDWDDADEWIFDRRAITTRTASVRFYVPKYSPSTNVTGRFRFTTQLLPSLGYRGLAPDGEVEDYVFKIGGAALYMDYGDAPTNYPTLRRHNGAAHVINSKVRLGARVDSENDGQPRPLADGDDRAGYDDEDGVTVVNDFQQGRTGTLQVVCSTSGYFSAWFDFGADMDWADPEDHVFDRLPMAKGTNRVNVVVPTNAAIGYTFARFRFTATNRPSLCYTGIVENGEVEDYRIAIEDPAPKFYDYGDAPDPPYPTLRASDGARHQLIGGIVIGLSVDFETDARPNADATGDENVGFDEDGVMFYAPLVGGYTGQVDVYVSGPGLLDAWVDFDRNGSWADREEQIFKARPVVAGLNTLSFPVSRRATTGGSFARVRLSKTAGLSFKGTALDGEVEDYAVDLQQGLPPLPEPVRPVCPAWLRPPDCRSGLDIASWHNGSAALSPAQGVADDWLSDGRPAVGCRWWGSYVGWKRDVPSDVAPPDGTNRPVRFEVALFADVPAEESGLGFSIPGTLLTNLSAVLTPYGTTNAARGTVSETYHCRTDLSSVAPNRCEHEYQYELRFPGPWGVVEQRSYWLRIRGRYDVEGGPAARTPAYPWGWLSTMPRNGWNDAAVVWRTDTPPTGGAWLAMAFPPPVDPWRSVSGHPYAGSAVNQAFEVWTEECPRRAPHWAQEPDRSQGTGVTAWGWRAAVRSPGPALAEETAPPLMRADDAVSDGRPIIGVRWWGGYAGWQSDRSGTATDPVAAPAVAEQPLEFHVAWYGAGACVPATKLADVTVPIAKCHQTYVETVPQTWKGDGVYEHLFQYDVDLLDPEVLGEAWRPGAGVQYWITVQALFDPVFDPASASHAGWGWWTVAPTQNCGSAVSADGAVWRSDALSAPHPAAGQPFDLAFRLVTDRIGDPAVSIRWVQPVRIARIARDVQGAVRISSVGDYGAGTQYLQRASVPEPQTWNTVDTNALPVPLPYSNVWYRTAATNAEAFFRVLQR